MEGQNEVYRDLETYFGSIPMSAERFFINDVGFDIDFLSFRDQPFQGVYSIITNGLSLLDKGEELIFTFDSATVKKNFDVNVFLATYIRIHYLKHRANIKPGTYFFDRFDIMNGYHFKGIYTADPVYFPEDFARKNPLAKFL